MSKQFVCVEVYSHSATQPPSLVIHFLKSSMKIVATSEIFSVKFTKYRLADPLGELKHSPRPSSGN